MPEWISHNDILIGSVLAFIFAFLIVAIDCNINLKSIFKKLTIPLAYVFAAWIVCALCGLLAVATFLYCAIDPDNPVSKAISLGTSNNYLRALTVGTSVLVLIRSKVMSVANSDVGLEYVYNLGRDWIRRSFIHKRTEAKDAFLNGNNIDRMMTIHNFDTHLPERVTTLIVGDPEDIRTAVATQIEKIKTTRPNKPFTATDADWRDYYYNLAGVAVDYCGVKPIARWLDNQAPVR